MLGIDTQAYSVRIARRFQGQDVCLIVDIDREFIRSVLASIDTGKGGCVVLVTSDGKEFYAEPGIEIKNTLIYGTEIYNKAVATEEPTGNQMADINGKESLFVYGKMETGNGITNRKNGILDACMHP